MTPCNHNIRVHLSLVRDGQRRRTKYVAACTRCRVEGKPKWTYTDAVEAFLKGQK
jgi:hypothetical protein